MNINLYGIHFHCGSGQHGARAFKSAIDIAGQCMDLGKKVGHRMKILDLGGGFPSSHLSDSQIDILSQAKSSNYTVVAEPGRHFSSESCHLAVRVIGKREKNGQLCYHVNDGLYHSFNGILMDGMNFEDQSD